MTRSRAVLRAAGAALLVVALAGCGERPADDTTTTEESQAPASGEADETESQEVAEPEPTGADDEAEAVADEPDDTAAEAEATGVLAADCPEVAPPPFEHTVVSAEVTEIPGGLECTTAMQAPGESLGATQQIAAQLDSAGHEQTSQPQGDDGAGAVNVMSYLIADDELHVTVRQDGPGALLVHYVLLSPAQGNG